MRAGGLLGRIRRQWQRLGPVGFAGKAVSMLANRANVQLERLEPSGISRRNLATRIPASAPLRERLAVFRLSPWLDPTWVRRLPDGERHDLLNRAEAVRGHLFDLLGSGPVRLGETIDWRADFKHGRRWPAAFWRSIIIAYGDGSDIKVPWELSRCQHLPLLGQAWWLTGDPGFPAEFQAQVESWWADNPAGFGPNWACPMDVAIRAVNWIDAALTMQDAPLAEPFWLALFRSLLVHGHFIRRHLENRGVRSNHYLADLVGLLYLGALFDDLPEGRGWWRLAWDELVSELKRQVRPDGTSYEASLSYHRLATELFLAADALTMRVGEPFDDASRHRIGDMRTAVGAYLHGSRAPQLGDSDDGRLQRLSDYGRQTPWDHRHLWTEFGLTPPGASQESRRFPDSGYYILRHGDQQVTVHCGDTGLQGLGAHGHNDALAFDWWAGPHPLVVDPGTWVYTADAEGRNRFRSTAFHATLQIDGEEQNPFDPALLFELPDVSRAECLLWEPSAGETRFQGCHHGYERLPDPVSHTRSLCLNANGLTIEDRLTGRDVHELAWFFPMPDLAVDLSNPAAARTLAVDRPNVAITLEGPAGFQLERLPGAISPGYGQRYPAMRLCYRLCARLPITVRFRLSLCPAEPS